MPKSLGQSKRMFANAGGVLRDADDHADSASADPLTTICSLNSNAMPAMMDFCADLAEFAGAADL